MDFLTSLLAEYNIPVLSALILGIMTSISPCPLATNITATAYISQNISNKRKVLFSGLLYSLGRALSYTSIGIVLFLGASKFHLAKFFNHYGERVLGPLLILIGLIMLGVIKLKFVGKLNFQEKFSNRLKNKGLLGSLLMGLLFALAFCPYSGALYFGVLIPMTITSTKGLFLPIFFALGTSLPVLLFTIIMAFAANKLSVFYNRIAKIEKGLRILTGVIFVLVGIYYVLIFLKFEV